jgi:hypothetical protein
MRVPHVSDRIKEAPAVALRGMLAGVGQLLLITDKLRNKTPAEDISQARTPEASESVPQPAPPAPEAPAPEATAPAPAPAATVPAPAPAADKTGNVRLLPEQTAPAEEEDAAVSAEAEIQAAEPKVQAAAPASGQSDLPLANYDELSVPSLRARLRNLTAAQVATLVEYEKAHADRAEVVTMFERRIAKLEAGG